MASHMTLVSKEFGHESANEFHGVLKAAFPKNREAAAAGFVEALPNVSCLLTGGFHFSEKTKRETFIVNAKATMKAMYGLVTVNRGTSGSVPSTTTAKASTLQSFRKHVLAGAKNPLVGSKNDEAALRFLAEVSVMSPAEVAGALKEHRGREFVQTLSDSPTFAAAVIYASWWDDVWDWLSGAAQWVVDAAKSFGDAAAKIANAVVDGVLSKYADATKFAEGIPIVGLLVAGIYYIAGKNDEGTAALAINVNAIVTLIFFLLGEYFGGAAGGMAGAAVGKALGLLVQKAIGSYIKDDKMRHDVTDITAAEFISEVALAAAWGGAGAVGQALGSAAGLSFVKTLCISIGLSSLLSRLPHYLVD